MDNKSIKEIITGEINKQFYTTKEAGDLLGIQGQSVHHHIVKDNPTIKAIKFGNKFVISEEEMIRILSEGY